MFRRMMLVGLLALASGLTFSQSAEAWPGRGRGIVIGGGSYRSSGYGGYRQSYSSNYRGGYSQNYGGSYYGGSPYGGQVYSGRGRSQGYYNGGRGNNSGYYQRGYQPSGVSINIGGGRGGFYGW
jgi:hypothetical protein